jgi:hypothetical protein
MHRIFSRTEIKDINNVKGIEEDHNSKLSGIDGFYKIAFKTEEPEPAAAQPSIKPIESAEGEVNVIEYSDKAIAVIGDTKPIKELLKSLGGSFNPRLSCGAGWIFSKKKLEEVQTALINHMQKDEAEEVKTESNNLPVLYNSTPSTVETIEEAEIIEHRHPLNICDPESNQYKEALKEYTQDHPKKYTNIIDITAAAKQGKQISLYNLFEIANNKTVNA